MNHDEVVRQKLTERYLLHELEDQARDEYEEHFFQCSECALDLRTASEFVETSKIILALPSEGRVPARSMPRKHNKFSWLGWLQPQFAAPALTLLLVAVGYQNLVTLPSLQSKLRQPQSLSWAALSTETYGTPKPIPIHPGQGFLLFIRIPPDGKYDSYTADLYNPAGRIQYSLKTPAGSVEDQWPVFIPEANHEAGSYRISLRGITASGEIKDLGSAPFTLQIAK
jgi:hypothetical protein